VPNQAAMTINDTAARERARKDCDLRAVSPIRRASRPGNPSLYWVCLARAVARTRTVVTVLRVPSAQVAAGLRGYLDPITYRLG
jgi:hypothetical protein